MRYFSTFTGVGGFDMGMPPDWECVGMSEIDKYANMVLKYRYMDVKNYGDIEKINYEELPDFDVLIGGSPCQDISVAGKRAGLAGLRSRLFFSYVALLKVKQPDYFIFENVKGLLSSNEGRDFAEVINQFSEAGYDIWWQVLDAADFGIPQHRERIFILGSLGGSGFRKVFLKRKDKGKDIELQRQQANTITRRYKQSQATGTYIAECKFNAQIVASRGRMENGQWVQKIESRKDNKCNALTSVQKDNMVSVDSRIRYLTPLECERLMGWSDNWTKYGIDGKGDIVELSDNARYNLIGNGVVPQVVREIVRHIMNINYNETMIQV